MSPRIRARLLGAALLAMAAAPAGAYEVLAALSSDSSHYREAFEGFQKEWGSSVPFVVLGNRPFSPLPPVDGIVAFGSRAALHDWGEAPLAASCLAPAARAERGGALYVELLPAPPVLMARLKKLLPRLKTLRVLWSSDLEESDVEELAAAGAALDVRVVSERVADPRRLPQALRALTTPADAFWLMPDPTLVNAENFATLKEYAAAAHQPFLAPTDGLAEKGATATLAVPFREVGRAAAAALRARLRGEVSRGHAHPERVVVTVNAAAARAVALDLTAAEGVDRVIP
jgi:hypothetical protein